jgi:hypothetical protein
MDEIALIRAARQGDRSFNRLVLAYQDLVFNQAYRLMGRQRGGRRYSGGFHLRFPEPALIAALSGLAAAHYDQCQLR